MSQSPSQFHVSSLNGVQQCGCWRHHSSVTLVTYASKKFWFWENRPCVRSPIHVRRAEIFHFKHPRVLTVNRTATRTFKGKKTTTTKKLIDVNTLTWITEKELEREKKRDQFCWKKNKKHFIAAVRTWEMLAATKVKMSGSEKNVNSNKYNISSIKRVTRKFLEVSRYSRAKQRQRNVHKKCTAREKWFLFCFG